MRKQTESSDAYDFVETNRVDEKALRVTATVFATHVYFWLPRKTRCILTAAASAYFYCRPQALITRAAVKAIPIFRC